MEYYLSFQARQSTSAIWYVLNRGLLLLVGFTNSKELVLVFHLLIRRRGRLHLVEKASNRDILKLTAHEPANRAALKAGQLRACS